MRRANTYLSALILLKEGASYLLLSFFAHEQDQSANLFANKVFLKQTMCIVERSVAVRKSPSLRSGG